MKHTPGPWKEISGAVYAYARGGFIPIAKMDREPGNGTLPTERDANARLIAAAPELLEACKLLVATWGSGDGAFSRLTVATQRAGDAIAKAEEGHDVHSK